MAFTFNGSNQVCTTSSTPVSALPLTIACVINPLSISAIGSFIGIDDAITYTSYRIRITTTGAIQSVASNSSGNNAALATSSATASAGQWAFVASVFNSSTLRSVYLDGVKNSDTTSFAIDAPTRITLGSTSGSNSAFSQHFNGSIAEAAIWNAALTDAEIASLAAGFTPDQIRPQSLQWYAPLVRDLVDVRGGRAITNVNGATVATHPRIIT